MCIVSCLLTYLLTYLILLLLHQLSADDQVTFNLLTACGQKCVIKWQTRAKFVKRTLLKELKLCTSVHL